jgi:hypothetical protein
MLSAQATNKEIAFPFRDQVAFIKYDTSGRYAWVSIVDWLDHIFFLLNSIANLYTPVLDPVSNDRPAIVFARLNDINMHPAYSNVLA